MSETENRRQILRMCKEAKVERYRFVFTKTHRRHNIFGTEWNCMKLFINCYSKLGYVIHEIELIEE